MHSANSERSAKGALHPLQESAQTALAVSEISKGLQCAITAITVVALWRLLHLGRRMCAYTLFGLHCEVTRVPKLRTVSNHSANSKRPAKGALHPIQECSDCTGSERNIQRITMCPHDYDIYIFIKITIRLEL